jgi:hypothetical protein
VIIPLPLFRARRANPSLVINGVDILLGLASQNIISFCYTDNTSDKADDLSIEIADPQRTWMLKYLPANAKKGIECTAGMIVYDWAFPGDTRPFECGIFYINHVGFKGPPNVVSVKATSIPPNGVKSTKKFKSWENTNLKSIAGEIASKNGLTLFYDTKEDPQIKRTDQSDKSDLEYLRDRCKESKLSLKVHKKQLIIYSEEEYEARPPAFTLTYGASNILDYDFNSKSDDTYKKCKNKFDNPETGKITETEFDPSINGGTIAEGTYAELNLNENPEYEPDVQKGSTTLMLMESAQNYHYIGTGIHEELVSPRKLEDADFFNTDPGANKGKGAGGQKNSTKKCKAKLREKNKKEHQCSFKVHGNIEYLSGLCCETLGFGIFDKKWFIESSIHDIANGGYSTNLKLRGALKGY